MQKYTYPFVSEAVFNVLFLKVLFQKENSLGIPNTQERKKRKKKKKKKCITDTGYTEVKVNLFFSF